MCGEWGLFLSLVDKVQKCWLISTPAAAVAKVFYNNKPEMNKKINTLKQDKNNVWFLLYSQYELQTNEGDQML